MRAIKKNCFRKMKTITFFRKKKKIIKTTHKGHNLACDNYILPKTIKGKQEWSVDPFLCP